MRVLGFRLLTLRVLHRLIYRENYTCCLYGGHKLISLHDRRLPHELISRIENTSLVCVHAKPLAVFFYIPRPQLVQHIGRVKYGIVTQCIRDELQILRERQSQQLLLYMHHYHMITQVVAKVHFNRTAARH